MTSQPYCGPGSAPQNWLAQWNLDPWLLAALALGLTVVMFTTSGQSRRCAVAAWFVLTVAFVSPLCALTSALFSARTLHHVLLIALAAPLIAISLTGARKPWGPGALAGATVLQAITLWLWHVPSLYTSALSYDAVYWLMQGSLLAAAIAFWRIVLSAQALSAGLALGVTMAQMGMLGALIALADQALYEPHLLKTVAWGLTPLEDQQLAGLLMWGPFAVIYLVAALVRIAPLLKDQNRRAAA